MKGEDRAGAKTDPASDLEADAAIIETIVHTGSHYVGAGLVTSVRYRTSVAEIDAELLDLIDQAGLNPAHSRPLVTQGRYPTGRGPETDVGCLLINSERSRRSAPCKQLYRDDQQTP